jgi:zinc transport system ATP-binding protein
LTKDTPALEINNLSVYYRSTPALTNLRLTVAPGEFLGIIGPNGGGKTTLLRAILGLVPSASGSEIKVFGKSPRSARGIGYVPQSAQLDRAFPISVCEVVMTAFLKGGAHPLFRYSDEHRKSAKALLERVGIADLADRHVSQLSGGEFQRLLIARALAVQPQLLLLDEPTASVDPSSRECIYDLLAELNQSMTILLVTHDMLAVSSFVTSIACLNRTLIYHGQPELTEDIVSNMYGCPVDLIAHGVPHRVLGRHDGEEGEGECSC